ncbi:ABC transporter ATP-binding protein [Phytoactinopolyspora mesophila]|nr:dipeptide/oligopeptide/nickel ABC transporter ATP-binding protein [Phytoactinopolyspora mesophila]
MTELLALTNVAKTYRQRRRVVTALEDVTLALHAGEILCLVGESGSGKSTIGRIVTGLVAPTSGDLRYRGHAATAMHRKNLRAHRLGVQMIHQDPYASLNPGMTVGATLRAPLSRHFRMPRREAHDRLRGLLADVGLTPPETFEGKYPHELSGGQRQRVSIARSLTVEPNVLVADEAVSMLDASIRVSILQMLRNLCEERQLAVLFITHDLAVARQFGRDHSIAVMQRGRIVEHRPTADLVSTPEHSYTHALLHAARHEGLRSKHSARAKAGQEAAEKQLTTWTASSTPSDSTNSSVRDRSPMTFVMPKRRRKS